MNADHWEWLRVQTGIVCAKRPEEPFEGQVQELLSERDQLFAALRGLYDHLRNTEELPTQAQMDAASAALAKATL